MITAGVSGKGNRLMLVDFLQACCVLHHHCRWFAVSALYRFGLIHHRTSILLYQLTPTYHRSGYYGYWEAPEHMNGWTFRFVAGICRVWRTLGWSPKLTSTTILMFRLWRIWLSSAYERRLILPAPCRRESSASREQLHCSLTKVLHGISSVPLLTTTVFFLLL